jgi:hypothetical protein
VRIRVKRVRKVQTEIEKAETEVLNYCLKELVKYTQRELGGGCFNEI